MSKQKTFKEEDTLTWKHDDGSEVVYIKKDAVKDYIKEMLDGLKMKKRNTRYLSSPEWNIVVAENNIISEINQHIEEAKKKL